MSDARKTRAQLAEELAALRGEVKQLRAGAHPEAPKELPGDYQPLFETMPESLLVVRVRDGRILQANPRSRELLGLTDQQLTAIAFYDLVPEAVRPHARAMMEAAAAGSRLIPPHDVEYCRPGGEKMSLHLAGVVVDSRPEATALLYILDTTESHHTRRLLEESEANYGAIFNAADDVLFIHDIETGNVIDFNPKGSEIYGYKRDEIDLLNAQFRSYSDAPYSYEDQKRWIRRAATGEPQRFEWLARDRNGRRFWMEVILNRVSIGGCDCVLAALRDIGARKRAEEALRESEARYRAVVETQTELIVRFGEGGVLTFVNEAYCRYFGKTREELIGRSFLPWLPEEDRRLAAERFAGICPAAPLVEHEHRVVMPSGETRWMHWTNHGVFDATGRLIEVQAVGRDITERRAAEDALRQSEENYRLLFEHSITGISIVQDGRFVKANEALCRIYCLPVEKVLGADAAGTVVPEDREQVARQISDLTCGKLAVSGGNYRILCGDGSIGWVEVRSGRMTWEGRPAVLAMVQDITERRRLEEELREAHKMEAVGQLAGGIAHDFNNLMTAILCHATLLKANAKTPDNRDTADVIEKAARRAADLTSQLLGFARRGKHQDVPVDLRATVQSVIRLTSGTLDPRIHIDTNMPPEPVCTRGDPAQMEQIVLNLAVNARDAMPDGGRLTFSLEIADLAPGHPHAKPGKYVLLRVADTGCGIPEDLRQHIFEPFFTTKPQGKGTGMGLAMVYGIARNHGGWVEVQSEVGRGSAFSVYLPLCAEAADGKPDGLHASAVAEPGPPTTGRILVVDDDEMVRNVVTRMLTGLGYSVLCAASCREAVASYSAFGGNADLVIIDLVMPDQDGRECFRALRRIDPNVRAILCTGAADDAATQDTLAEGMVGFIQKPYQLSQLAAAIGRALAAKRA